MHSTLPSPSTTEIPDYITHDIVREALMAARDVATRETSAEAAALAVAKAGIAAWSAIARAQLPTITMTNSGPSVGLSVAVADLDRDVAARQTDGKKD